MWKKTDFYTIEKCSAAPGTITAQIRINGRHAIFAGHFPGNPIVPGVCEMQLIKEIVAAVITKEIQLTEAAQIKFLHFISPAEATGLTVSVNYLEEVGGLSFSATIKNDTVDFFKMKGIFKIIR